MEFCIKMRFIEDIVQKIIENQNPDTAFFRKHKNSLKKITLAYNSRFRQDKLSHNTKYMAHQIEKRENSNLRQAATDHLNRFRRPRRDTYSIILVHPFCQEQQIAKTILGKEKRPLYENHSKRLGRFLLQQASQAEKPNIIVCESHIAYAENIHEFVETGVVDDVIFTNHNEGTPFTLYRDRRPDTIGLEKHNVYFAGGYFRKVLHGETEEIGACLSTMVAELRRNLARPTEEYFHSTQDHLYWIYDLCVKGERTDVFVTPDMLKATGLESVHSSEVPHIRS